MWLFVGDDGFEVTDMTRPKPGEVYFDDLVIRLDDSKDYSRLAVLLRPTVRDHVHDDIILEFAEKEELYMLRRAFVIASEAFIANSFPPARINFLYGIIELRYSGAYRIYDIAWGQPRKVLHDIRALEI